MTTEQSLRLPRRRLPLRGWIPYALLAVACGLSVAASWYVSATAQAQKEAGLIADEMKFEADAENIRQQIEFRLTAYTEVVRAAAALIRASDEINGTEFRAFVRGLQVRDRYPGMVGIGFAPRVARQNLGEFVRSVTLDSARRFRLWPADLRPVNYPVLFLEPVERTTRRSIGFNLSVDPVLDGAMKQARDTGQPTLSPVRNTLPFPDTDRGAFVLLIPVYRPGMPQGTADERRNALTGFVFSPLAAEEVLKNVVANTTGLVSLQVYDGSSADAANVLAESTVVRDHARFESTGSLQVAGRTWLVVVRSLEAPVRIDPEPAGGTLVAGLLLSVLLFFITRTQVRAWEAAARHEAELRASAQALRESEAQAHAADRAKDEFLATLSHELRTPVNAILGWVTMLRHGSLGEDKRAHGLSVIERNARLQAHLIEDLLDVSRIIMGKVQLRMRPLPIATVIAGAVESLRPSAEVKGVLLKTLLLSDHVLIRGDAERIQQIVWNLVANAIKFTPAGGHVDVELSRDEQHAHICVRDTGIGIPAEFLPHVFERFRQADSSTTRSHTGIGIGLSIVQHLVELHGGSIEVRSEGQDRGAEFLIHFPVVARAPGISAASSVGQLLPSPTLVDGLRVLVVDDDPDTREMLATVLSASGAKVTAVGSAREALDCLMAQGADVVVSDIAMPDEDGLSLIRQIRGLAGPLARVPAIALTAFARADDRARALEAGYHMHLAKPVELAELQAGLAALTATRT